MKSNRLIITIKRPIKTVFEFLITPPNSTVWIPGVVKEEVDLWPIQVESVYKLTNKKGEVVEYRVTAIKPDQLVEWVSKNGNYHCQYTFVSQAKNLTEFKYYEWVNKGELEGPFELETLQKLKLVLES